MCLIIVKPAGAPMPPQSHFENAWDSNPHGFGAIMSNGYFSVDTFRTLNKAEAMNLWAELKSKEDKIRDLAMSFHFRLATHGSKKESNCHAFTDKKKHLGFQHNGIIHIGIPKGCDMTDSEVYFKNVVLPIYNYHGKDMDVAMEYLEAIEDGYNKLSFIWNNQHYLIGRFTHDNGLYYSNSGYLRSSYSYPKAKASTQTYVDLPCATCTSLNCYSCSIYND